MDLRELLLTLLTGISAILNGPHAYYYYVNEPKPWHEAREYCQKTYTDLAIAETAEDMDQLLKAAEGTSAHMAWIGLQRGPMNWKWSNGEDASYHGWDRSMFCAIVNARGNWEDTVCSYVFPFICYTETQNHTQNYILIQDPKTWSEALQYCREHHTDLVSIRNMNESEAVRESAGNTLNYWIGLSNDPWKWSNGEDSMIRDWGRYQPNNVGNNQKCTFADEAGWIDFDCNSLFFFHCCNDSINAPMWNRCTINYWLTSWSGAVDHCKRVNKTLLTVRDQADAFRLSSLGFKVWIGLYYYRHNWTWSSGENVGYTSWQPTNDILFQLCAKANSEGYWKDELCSTSLPFMCYTETQNHTRNYILIQDPKTWSEALQYCREHHTDLVSIRNVNESEAVREMGKAVWEFWIGLFNDPWMWADRRNSKSMFWKKVMKVSAGKCVSVDLSNAGKGMWSPLDCASSLSFFCSGVPTVHRLVLRVNVRALMGDLNIQEPTVAQAVLTEIRKQLSRHNSMDNITLYWREQNGKIFHKYHETNNIEGQCDIP